MGAIALRRTKESSVDGKRLVQLPEKTVHIVPVTLSDADRAVYSRWEAHGAPCEQGLHCMAGLDVVEVFMALSCSVG